MNKTRKLRPVKEAKGSWLDKLGEALHDAGTETARLAKMGAAKAELKREHWALRDALGDLGQALVNVWAKEPRAAVSAEHPGLQKALQKVAETQERIEALETRIQKLGKAEK